MSRTHHSFVSPFKPCPTIRLTSARTPYSTKNWENDAENKLFEDLAQVHMTCNHAITMYKKAMADQDQDTMRISMWKYRSAIDHQYYKKYQDNEKGTAAIFIQSR